jgi:ATP-dependent RNA helicase RhlE
MHVLNLGRFIGLKAVKSMYRQLFSKNRSNQFHRNGNQVNHHGRPRMRSAHVDPSRYVNRITESEKVSEQTISHQFSDFAISSVLKVNIVDRGYTVPTPIQDQVIPYILNGRDVVGIANTGTGKTAAFLIPLIDKVLHDGLQKILIIAPTRELAVQIDDELRLFSRGLHLRSAILIGGASMGNQVWKLKQHPNFIIATPGRLRDFINQRLIQLGDFKTVVLDEVDRMVDIGFIVDIRYFLSLLPTKRQSLFFSATVPVQVEGIIRSFLTDPVTVSVKVNDTASTIDQNIIRVRSKEEKLQALSELLKKAEFSKVLIFGRTKWNVEKLARTLADNGFAVGSIHGNKTQGQRLRALSEFKQNRLQILVATDVASRGLDICDVSHVINYDEPQSYDDYIHRIGRTGRANKTGTALTFVG